MPSSEEAEYLAAALAVFPDLRRSAIEKGKDLTLFDPLVFPAEAMIWDVISRMEELNPDEPIGAVSIACELKSRNSVTLDSNALEDALGMLDELSELSESDFNKTYANKILSAFLVQAKKADIVRRLQEVTDLDSLTDVVNNSADSVATLGETGEPDLEMPLMDPDAYMPQIDKIPTGVSWIDYLSGGGHTPGEMIGILGPQGGGKTLTATSLLVAQAKRERNALLITYEQGTAGDVAQRLYTRLIDDVNGDLLANYDGPLADELRGTRVDVGFFRKYNTRQWPSVVYNRYADLQNRYGRFVTSLDFSKAIDYRSGKLNGTRGVMDIDAAIQWCKNRDKKIVYLIIDWFWPAVTRWFYNQNDKRLTDELRCATQFLYNLKQLTEREQLITVIFHQLDNEHTRASPVVQPNVTNALNMHSFSQVMQHCYVIGNRDKESNVMWLGNDKARTGVPQYILGQMDGAMGIIDKTDGYELSRGRFLPKDATISEEEDDKEIKPRNRYI